MSFSSPSGVSAPKTNISGYKTRNVANFTPEQMQLFAQLLSGAQGGAGIKGGLDRLSRLSSGDESEFESLEAPSYAAFDKLLGQIGSRFAGLGALNSSAFQNATSGAAQSLAQNLGAQRHGIQEEALDRLLGLSERLLSQRPYESFLEKKNKGSNFGSFLGNALGSLPSFLSLI